MELERPMFGRPALWALFAAALLAVPLLGFALQHRSAGGDLSWSAVHPALNALLNATSAVLLTLGWRAIKRRQIERHWKLMVAAFTTSSLFLVSYLLRFYLSGTHRYPGDGWDKALYLAILFSHMLLAALLVPLALRALYLGARRRDAKHRRLARWTWPIWMYVSITGVVIYLMLYPIARLVYG
jgi:putative membrane protein